MTSSLIFGTVPVHVEQKERTLVEKLLATVDLNQQDSDLVQASVHIPFRRLPKPAFRPRPTNLSDNEAKMYLAWAWEAVIVTVDVAFLYNGTSDSEAIFNTATGVTPAKFAQGFLEAEGSLWRFFYLESGVKSSALVEALLALWAEKVKALSQSWKEGCLRSGEITFRLSLVRCCRRLG